MAIPLDHGEIVLVVERDLQGFAEGAVVVGDDHTDIPVGLMRNVAFLGSGGSSHQGAS